MQGFCTIITASHVPYARALFQSLKQFDEHVSLNVLVVDQPKDIFRNDDQLKFHDLESLTECSVVGKQICAKYSVDGKADELRWSLKPVFINHLIEQGYEKVIFTDPDTYYFSNHTFLFEELNENDVLLTPHWRGQNPLKDRANFELQFVDGLFNGGFIGARNSARHIMDWWAECCLYRCEKNSSAGHYVDQTYLNLMPVYFENVKILRHRGCNVASWNRIECNRELTSGEVRINGLWKIVFIHFTASTIAGILKGEDPLLRPYLDEYLEALRRNGLELDVSVIPARQLEIGKAKTIQKWAKRLIDRLSTSTTRK